MTWTILIGQPVSLVSRLVRSHIAYLGFRPYAGPGGPSIQISQGGRCFSTKYLKTHGTNITACFLITSTVLAFELEHISMYPSADLC